MRRFLNDLFFYYLGCIWVVVVISLTGRQVVMEDDYKKYKAVYEQQLEGSAKCDNKTIGVLSNG